MINEGMSPQIRSYFRLGCEVKALGRGHLARIKREVMEKKQEK